MANITCYSELNFGGFENIYTTSMPDITKNDLVKSAKVRFGSVEVYQLKEYKGASAILPEGDYPNTDKFPEGVIASLKIE